MKHTSWLAASVLIGLALVCPPLVSRHAAAHAAGKPYRVVFDLTSRDSLDQRAVMRWVREISAADPSAEMEVVMYGKGFELVMPDRSTQLAAVQEAARNPKVRFRVCAVALKSNQVDTSQLIHEAATVPDGIHEIVMRQQEGWGYIKVVAPR